MVKWFGCGETWVLGGESGGQANEDGIGYWILFRLRGRHLWPQYPQLQSLKASGPHVSCPRSTLHHTPPPICRITAVSRGRYALTL